MDYPRRYKEVEPGASVFGNSDDGSAPASIFSLQTMLSTAITEDSLLTHAEIKRATDELISIFLDDRELKIMYRAATDDKRIGPDRFARNFKRLLKAFSLDLKEEARILLMSSCQTLFGLRPGL